MTMLDTIQSLSAGPLGWGTLVGAVALLVRATATALEKRSEAVRLAAHANDVTAQTVQSVLDEMRGKIDRLEKSGADCERRYAEALDLIDGLREEVETLRALVHGEKAAGIVKAAVGNVATIESVQRARKDKR